MSELWHDFWRDYRRKEVKEEADLFSQVGLTINRAPIPLALFKRQLDHIRELLELSTKDHLMDLCCGNGLFDYELAVHVRRITGVDFTEHLIKTARQLKSRPNIAYHLADACGPLLNLVEEGDVPTKILMNDCLAYFEPNDLDTVLRNVLELVEERPFLFLIKDVPNWDLRFNFYDTPERVARYKENQ